MSGWALALNFSEEQDFMESNLITADHVEKTGKLFQRGSRILQSCPLRTPNSAGAASLNVRGNDASERSSSGILQ
jgi:hypothetical protein